MANVSFSKTAGQTEFQITIGTDAPTTGDMEVTFNASNLHGGNIEAITFLKEVMNQLAGKATGLN